MSKNAKSQLRVEQVPTADLKPAVYNPRRHSPEALEELKKSIRFFGMVDPLLANSAPARKNILIGGHMRLKAALELGMTLVPVVYVNISSIEKEKELNLRLNRNTGEWDLELLKSFDVEFLLEAGFDDMDLSSVWNDALETEDDNFQIEKELAAIKQTNIKTGNKFQIGNHFLVCGDNSDINIVKKLMGNEKASIIYFDPQYNVGLRYATGVGNGKNYGPEINDKKSDAEYKEFLKVMLANGLLASRDAVHVFCYCDQNYVGLVQTIYTELGIKNLRTCIWVKNGFSPTPQIAFNRCYEPCVYGVKGKPFQSPINNLNEILNKEIGTGNRTIEDIADEIDIWLVKRLPGQEYQHATSKPPTLHDKPIRRCTKINDIVIDFSAGSGSTAISCQMLKRRCFMIEREPIYCQLIINRLEALTGEKAKLINK